MKFDYELPTPPFAMRPFSDLSHEEAEIHFRWFIGIGGDRAELLLKAMAVTGDGLTICDYSPESLIPVWAWVSSHLQKKTNTKLTPGSLALVLDTGFYLAEVFLRRYPRRLRWTLWKRKTGPYHKPVIEGFSVPLVPSDLVKACAWISLESKSQDDLLYKKFLVWARKLERPN